MNPDNNAAEYDYVSKIKKNNKTTLIFFLLIIVGVTIYTTFFSSGSTSIEFGSDYLRLTAPDGDDPYEHLVMYDEILSVSTVTKDESLDLGEMVDGTQTKTLWYGTWKNSEYGEYTLYASPKFYTYTVIKTADEVLVMNIEGDETTESFSDAMVDLLTQEGYWSTENGK